VKKASVNLFSKILSVFILAGLFMFVSCGDDDSVDCNQVIIEIGPILEAMVEAETAQDCAGLQSSYADFIDLFRRGKSCSIVQEILADEEYENVEDYIADLEVERDNLLVEWECN
jgi:hypothetical protein